MTLIVVSNFERTDIVFSLDYRIIVGLFLIFLLPFNEYYDVIDEFPLGQSAVHDLFMSFVF